MESNSLENLEQRIRINNLYETLAPIREQINLVKNYNTVKNNNNNIVIIKKDGYDD